MNEISDFDLPRRASPSRIANPSKASSSEANIPSPGGGKSADAPAQKKQSESDSPVIPDGFYDPNLIAINEPGEPLTVVGLDAKSQAKAEEIMLQEEKEDSEARFNREVGERLRHLREVLGMTLTDVARRLEVTRQTLSNYESGRTPLRASVIRELAEIYEASCDWILGVEDDIEIQTNANGRSLYMRERSPQIYPASVKNEDDRFGYDMMLQEKAMEEEQRRFAEYGDQF